MKKIVMGLQRLVADERGQVLPIAAFCMVGLLGMCAIGLDMGRGMYTYRELQATTDSSALAGARMLTTIKNSAGNATSTSDIVGSPYTLTATTAAGPAVTTWSAGGGNVAAQYSAVPGGLNVRTSLPSVTVSATLKCLSTLQTQGQPCIGSVPYNAVQVTQKTTIPMYFAGLFGHPTWDLTTESTASARGGSPKPSNIAVIMDMTLSTLSYDSDCSNTELQCELNGMQVLLNHLSPCSLSQTACATSGVVQNAFDQVALFTFPAVAANTAYLDTSCTTAVPQSTTSNGYWNQSTFGNFVMPINFYTGKSGVAPFTGIPTGVAYTFPDPKNGSYYVDPATSNGTYQLLGFSADYRVFDSATALNPYSALVRATGAGVSNGGGACAGMAPPNYDGVYGTYYAGAVYAAQSALVAQQTLYPNNENVIIILSDGDATSGEQNQNQNGTTVYLGPGNTWDTSYSTMPAPADKSGNYPSYVGECGQAIQAAKAATAAGTLVYSVAYGSSPVGCYTDQNAGLYPNVYPCDTMANMASASQYFYSDWKQSGSGSNCISSQPVTSLNGIFKAIADDLTETRLIPNNTP